MTESKLSRRISEFLGDTASTGTTVCVAEVDAGLEARYGVGDDGIGFDMVEVMLSPDDQHGLGLMGMFERVELLGGQMEIDTAPGYGTQILIQVPIGAADISAPQALLPTAKGTAYA